MAKQIHLIEVFYQDNFVGKLAIAPDRCSVFEYEPEWIRSGFSISPFYLPLKSGAIKARPQPFDGLFGVFNDSLPDGWGKLLTDRWLREHRINPDDLSVLDRLALVGSRGMGALTYKPDHNIGASIGRQPLDFYAAEVEKILRDEDNVILDEMMQTAGSSIGARPKVLVTIDEEEWLVKFRASVDPINVGQIEYDVSIMAKKCSIEMAETRLFHGKYFGARRFDIEGGKHFHVHSASGLLYVSHRLPSLDYSGLMKATLALTHSMNEAAKLFRLMVFNVLIGNKDDHAKNFSFIYRNNAWSVSPAYDLLPSTGLGGQHTTTVNGQGNPTRKDCMEVARLTGFPKQMAAEIIDEIETGVQKKLL